MLQQFCDTIVIIIIWATTMTTGEILSYPMLLVDVLFCCCMCGTSPMKPTTVDFMKSQMNSRK